VNSALIGELVYLAVREIMALAEQAHKGEITGEDFHNVVMKFSNDLREKREARDVELADRFKGKK
jgi:hypothetical protein